MDKISNAIKCVNCLKILSSPMLLPCSHSVCKAHIDQTDQSCMCNECGILHSEGRFYANKALSDMIEAQLGSFDFGQIHKVAKTLCQQLDDSIDRVDVVLKDPDLFAHEKFSELRRKVDLKYEEYKLKLDQETQKIMTELENIENEYKKKLKSSNNSFGLKELQDAKQTAQSELRSYMSVLNELKMDENKWKDIQQQCNQQIERLQSILSSFEDSLSFFINDKELHLYSVEFTAKIDIDDLFEFERGMKKLDSNIITGYKMTKDILKLCEFKPGTKFSLLYRATRDGFDAQNFHSKCDSKPKKLLKIIKATNGCIFGEYTEDIKSGFKIDPNAYFFSLINKENTPIKIRISNSQDWADHAKRIYTFLDGSEYFEIEVFQISD